MGTLEYARFDQPGILHNRTLEVGAGATVDVWLPGTDEKRCTYAPGVEGQLKRQITRTLYRFRLKPTAAVGDVFPIHIGGAVPLTFRLQVAK